MNLRIVIADDHPIIRTGIRNELLRHPGFDVVGEAMSGDDVLEVARSTRPDVLIVDINMPGMRTLRVIDELRKQGVDCKILILTAYKDIGTVLGMLKAGVNGYLLKDEDPSILHEAIQSIVHGHTWLSPELAEKMETVTTHKADMTIGDVLTDREEEVLQCLVRGLTNRQIAKSLETSERTIEFHVTHILEKLGVSSRLEAALWAKEHGLF